MSWLAPSAMLSQLPNPRESSCSGSGWLKSGGSYDDALPLSLLTREGEDLQLGRYSPQWQLGDPLEELSYGVYRWNLRGFTGSPTMKFSWEPDFPVADFNLLYIGFANINRDTWDWYQGPADSVLTIESYGPYRDATGEMLMIIVLEGENAAVLTSMEAGAPEVRGTGAEELELGSEDGYPVLGGDGSLPASIDLTAACAPVNDQGTWGSCTAFAVGDGAYNYELNMLYGGMGWKLSDSAYRISPKFLYITSGEQQGFPPSGDFGRWTDQVIGGLLVSGVSTEKNAPYDLIYDNEWSPAALADAQVLRINSWQTVFCNTWQGLTTVKSILALQRKPLPMQMYLDASFFDYQAGEVWLPDGSGIVGGHAMCIVGYDDAKSAFKVRNSWSAYWGENGYVWIGYEAFLDYATSAMAFTLTDEYDPAVVSHFKLASGNWAPVLGVSASDGTTSNGVAVSWDQHPLATQYLVYRDEQTNLIQIVAGASATSWLDAAGADGYGHVYWVRASNGTNSSPLSAPDVGYAAHAPEVLAVNPLTGIEGSEIVFSASGYGSGPLTYSWDFGGGAAPNTSSDSRPVVVLGAPGEYSAQLTLSNGLGSNTYDYTLTVTGVQPRINFIEQRSGFSGDSITPQADIAGTPETYHWDFGGGASPNTSTANSPAVTLGAPGSYEASLTISSGWGDDTYNFFLTVLETTPASWTIPGHDWRHSGQSAATGPQTNNVKWKYFAGDLDGLPVTNDIEEVLALSDGAIIVSCDSRFTASLRRLNPDGTAQWTNWLAGELYFDNPLIGDDSGNLYTSQWPEIVAYDPVTGTERWRASGGAPVGETAGKLYVLTNGRWLSALDTDDGTEVLAPIEVGDRILYHNNAVLAPNGMLFIGSKFGYDPLLIAFDTRTDVPAGSLFTVNQVNGLALSPDGSTLYATDTSYVRAYDTQSCIELWWRILPGSLLPARIMADGSVVVANSYGLVTVLHPETGATLWSYDLGLDGDNSSIPAIGRDGTVYLGGADKKLYALRDGELSWTSPDATAWYFNGEPSMGPDGTLYCSDKDGWVWAFGPGSGELRVPPHVSSVAPYSGDTGAELTISANTWGSAPLTYAWNFGGGAVPNTSALPSPTVTLSAVGTYDASLTLSNAYDEFTYEFLLRVFSPGGNTPPSADLQAAPASGSAPLDVQLDASGSFDLEGPISSYDWAPHGDHVYDNTLGHSSTLLYRYMLGGSYQVWVKVTDLDGAVDEASFTIEVSSDQSWHIAVLDSEGETGIDPDMGVIGGVPVVAYYNNDSPQTLYYLTATDAHGDAWNSRVSVNNSGNPGRKCSLALIDGRPAIAYYNAADRDLYYVRANDAGGLSWPAASNLLHAYEGNMESGFNITLLSVNGRPAISFLDLNTYLRLHYIRALDATGDSWPATSINVDTSGREVGRYNSMQIVSGYPAIAYCDSEWGDMMFVRALDADGSAWGTPLSIEGGGAGGNGTGTDGMLAIIDGKPAVTYSSASGASFCRAQDAAGSSWSSPIFYDDSALTSAIAEIGGTLVALLRNSDHSKLFVRRAVDVNGSSWQPAENLTTTDSIWSNIDLADVNGHPAAVWYDNSKYELKYAIYY